MKTSEELKAITAKALCKIGDLVKAKRTEKGLKLSDVYRLSGVSSSVISDLENHKGVMPNIYTLMAIANALELPQEAFLELLIGDNKEKDKSNMLMAALLEYGLPSSELSNVKRYIDYCVSEAAKADKEKEKGYTKIINGFKDSTGKQTKGKREKV